jgi:hypothetical protein
VVSKISAVLMFVAFGERERALIFWETAKKADPKTHGSHQNRQVGPMAFLREIVE